MTGPAEIEALAAEYVLGTLDAAERATVSARLQREAALKTAVEYWQNRLSPLDDLAHPVAVPAHLMPQIERRLSQGHASSTSIIGTIGHANVERLANIDAVDLQRRVRRWRMSTLAASAIAASLAVVIGVREFARPTADQNFVAVFQKDDAAPSFVMSVDLASRTVSVRRVAAEVPAGKTFQLWIASDKLGVGPQSLGLVEGTQADVKKAISGIDPAIVQHALFGVSLEPAGGSPTGKPTGPVFHAHLIPTSG